MAPPIDILDRIKGYEMVSFETISVPPPIEVDEQDSKGQEDVNGDENSQVPKVHSDLNDPDYTS